MPSVMTEKSIFFAHEVMTRNLNIRSMENAAQELIESDPTEAALINLPIGPNGESNPVLVFLLSSAPTNLLILLADDGYQPRIMTIVCTHGVVPAHYHLERLGNAYRYLFSKGQFMRVLLDQSPLNPYGRLTFARAALILDRSPGVGSKAAISEALAISSACRALVDEIEREVTLHSGRAT